MKPILARTVFGLSLIVCFGLMFSGCGSAPTADISATKKALTAVQTDDVRADAPESLKAAEDELSKALAAVQAEDGKFFLSRDYGKASETLKSAKSLADKARADAETNRVNVKADAEAALAELPPLIDEAKRTLAKAPRGKDTRADLEAMQGDLKLAEEALNEANQAMTQAKYMDALTKANSAKEKASAVVEQVNKAMAKARGRR